MKIGMLRHGIAEDYAATDFDRALTEAGHLDLERVLDVLEGWHWRPGAILHSPLIRTTETAEHCAAHWPDIPIRPFDALALGFLDAILQGAAAHSDPLLIGHEPTMGMLCGRLIGAPVGAVRFERGGFALVEADRLPTTRPARLLLFLPPQSIELSGR